MTTIDERVRRVARTVLDVNGVADLHGGTFGTLATYLPGEKVVGVKIDDTGIDIHVSLHTGSQIHSVADNIRAAVSRIEDGPISITIEDLV
ncbi:Asp23/Gls24 family envelope stress response protein [Hoyosella rhizosphaerae]|uniref:Asp23/Gls24 family envelope stress response protein n=1 Tax=Hoyosella rhizosphaerae TaxID=1755582 RepID=A0A916UKB8_9ACTN|nr:Asp23/Gls24 family envelope stress response protein [Hoyosella rhizosphaerae]MBN4925437.1 Asp23/Gls24 family envelope stress response protein [Hoyosella rhizosphaerae]GGC75203.1 hypothetical protein GCM10011410_30640 [Hoyosella rhizosphaerae]